MKRYLGPLILSLMAMPLSAETLTTGTIGKYSLTPEPGKVENITSVCIKFQNPGIFGLEESKTISDVSLSCDDGTEYKVCKAEYDADFESCTMFFSTSDTGSPTEIYSPGQYTLFIPEGTFRRAKKTDYYNGLITAVYEIEGPASNSLTTFTLTPSTENPVESIQNITVTFPDATATGIELTGNMGDIKLSYGNTIYKCVVATVNDNTVSLGFANADGSQAVIFAHPGEYSLLIPKGMIAAKGTQETNGVPINASYTIENPTFNSMSTVITIPSDKSTISSFSEVSLTFPNATYGLDIPSDLNNIKLRINGVDTRYIAGNLLIKAPFDNVSFSFKETEFGEPVTFTDTGKYEILIPAGVFSESGHSDYRNEAISLTFNILNPEDANPFHKYSVTPADNSTVGELYELSIAFPETGEAGIKWPFDISQVTLQRIGDDTVYTGNSAMLKQGSTVITGFGIAGNQYSEKLHFRTPGEYIVTIPAGVFTSEENNEISNSAICLRYTVDPAYNFTYKLSPAAGSVLASLSEIKLSADDALKSVKLNAESTSKAILSSGELQIELTASSDENGVTFTPSSTVEVGEWTLTIPAGLLSGVTQEEINIINAEPISCQYTVKNPKTFTYTTTPSDGQTIPLFTKFVVGVLDSPKKVTVNTDAGQAVLKGNNKEYNLSGKVSGTDVMFAVNGGASLSDGQYTVNIPAGYIVTTDADKLTAELPEISGTFTIEQPEAADYNEGLFIFNEGWYGKDMASFTLLPPVGPVRYNVFMENNPSYSLGLTGTEARHFGDKLYAVCKQDGANLSGIEGGVLTQIDAASMKYVDNIVSLEKGEQARAFCGVSGNKGYLSTSAGIYPVDLSSMTLGERFAAVSEKKQQHGSMLYYQGRVYAAVKDWDLIVIDPADDSMSEILTGPAVTTFVTPDGNIFTATLDEAHEFYKINPETLEAEYIEIKKGDYDGRTRVADVWRTWTPIPLAVDKTDNVVYYATETNAAQIARLNLDNGEFTPDFIKLPETESGQQIIYGQGISVDPRNGEIVLVTVEKGYGAHYTQNYVYRVEPKSGKIIDDKTIKLSENYWFPSMVVYNGYTAPELNLEPVSLAEGNVRLNLHEHTVLAMGNKYEIEYTVESSDDDICKVVKLDNGQYMLSPKADGTAIISVKAEFMGLTSDAQFTTSTSSIESVADETSDLINVYTTSGLHILKNADKTALNTLPKGIYIVNGKKYIVR